MPKRKASSPMDKNGLEEGDSREDTVDSTPKRSMSLVSPNRLDFMDTATEVADAGSVGKLSNFTEELQGHIEVLNDAFLIHIKKALYKDPSVSLVPILNDYLAHTETLMFKYRIENQPQSMAVIKMPEVTCTDDVSIIRFSPEDVIKIQKAVADSRVEEAKNALIANQTFNGAHNNAIIPPLAKEIKDISPPKVLTKAGPGGASELGNSPFKGFQFGSCSSSSGNTGMSLFGSSGNVNHVFTRSSDSIAGTSSSGSKGSLSAFTFGLKDVKTNGVGGAGEPTLFSFKAPTPPTDSSSHSLSKIDEKDAEEGDEPPKNEFTPVVETDSLYSVRCKLFGIVNEGKKMTFKDKGIGQLFIKKLENKKHQLLVRADNNLGTIILNIQLQAELPLSKKSAKDVMTVDPVGDKGKPLPILIRVKNEELATELLENLLKYSKAS